MSQHEVEFVLNGERVHTQVEASWTIVDVLRRRLGWTGTKLGCGVGVCGVCSVLVDGTLLSGCLFPAVQLPGADVVTIEGIAGGDGALTSLQQAFIDQGGFQCGICTSGQVVAATALLRERSDPAEDEIVEWMKGNLCRCTGYYGIVRAIRAAAGSDSAVAGVEPAVASSVAACIRS